MKTIIIVFVLTAILLRQSFAWDGYDLENGEQIEILPGHLVKQGSIIEYYNHSTASNHVAEVIELEYGYSSGARLILRDMDKTEEQLYIMEE